MQNLYSLVSIDVDGQNGLFLNTHWFVQGVENFKNKWFAYNFKPVLIDYFVKEFSPEGVFVREHELKEFLEEC